MRSASLQGEAAIAVWRLMTRLYASHDGRSDKPTSLRGLHLRASARGLPGSRNCPVRPLPFAAPRAPPAPMNLHDFHDWAMPLATTLGAVIVGILAYVVLRPIARRISRHA